MWKKAARVRVVSDVDLKPHTVLTAGEQGVIARTYEDTQGVYAVDVRMEKFHKGLAEWDNEAHLTFPEIEALEPVRDTSALDPRRLVTIAAGVASWVLVHHMHLGLHLWHHFGGTWAA